MADTHRDVEALETLASTLTESIEGYEAAAEAAKGSSLGGVLHRKAREREVISRRFRQRIAALGGNPVAGASDAAPHHPFHNLRRLLAENREAAVAEVARSEEYLKQCFESCLSDPQLNPDTKALLSGTYDRVKFDDAQWDQLTHAAR